ERTPNQLDRSCRRALGRRMCVPKSVLRLRAGETQSRRRESGSVVRKDQRAIDALIELLDAPDYDTARYARSALTRIHNATADVQLKDRIQSELQKSRTKPPAT